MQPRRFAQLDVFAHHALQGNALAVVLDGEGIGDAAMLDFARWTEIAAFNPAQLTAFMARGKAMDEKFSKLAADIAGGSQPIIFNGQRGLMVNAPGVFHSLVGDLLSQQSGTFALMWVAGKGGIVRGGLRSQHGFDCIPLAESLGGGGHAQACGFKMGTERLPELLSGVFEAAAKHPL